MSPVRPAPLDTAIRGDTNLFSFVVTVNYNHDLLMETYEGAPEVDVPERVRDHHMTLTHEGIHFFHAMSTSYLYRLAVSLWREVRHCKDELQKMSTPVRLPVLNMERLATAFEDLSVKSTALSHPQISGISALDVIEGAAVFISHRMHLPDIDHLGFLNRLDAFYGSEPSPYCDAFRLGDWYLGDDLFEVFSPLCFAALCSANPGVTYCRSIEMLGRSGIFRRNRHPSFREISEIIRTPDIGDLRTAPEEFSISGTHPILTPYIRQLLQEQSDLHFTEFAARPYESHDLELFKYLTPPLVRFADGHALLSPKLPKLVTLPLDISKEDLVRQYSAFLIHLNALCGAVLAMAAPADYYMQCPHRDCPYFSLRLCHAFAPIPKHYKECGFIVTFEDVFETPSKTIVRQ